MFEFLKIAFHGISRKHSCKHKHSSCKTAKKNKQAAIEHAEHYYAEYFLVL